MNDLLKAALELKAINAGNNPYASWAIQLAETIADKRTTDDGEVPYVEAVPMEREGTFLIMCRGVASVVIHRVEIEGGTAYVSFQPEIPKEATQYATQPPIKTRPLNNEEDLFTLAESISMFAGTDFLTWQATAILESAKAAHWNGFSAALVEAVSREAWAPNVSKGEDGSVTMKVGKITAKANADKLAISYNGKPEGYLSILRGVFRGGGD